MGNVLQINDLKVEFHVNEGVIRAVDGVSFRVPERRTVAVVGESGSGKSVVSQAIMGILPKAGRITAGSINFYDPAKGGAATDIASLPQDGPEMRAIRGGRISIIFQEPMTSLSPLHTVGDQVSEALKLHRRTSTKEALSLTEEMLRLVGFPNPNRALRTYPFELSGGLRQRAMIAMALVCRPALLIADEPTTALDVTIQAQILKLIRDLQDEFGMAVLIITHDLGVVANVADEVVVMYHGRVMESGTLDDIFRRAEHPYLKALLRAVPRFDMQPGERLVPIREIESEMGHLMQRKEPWPEGADAAPLLDVKGLSKRFSIRRAGMFGGKTGAENVAVDDVSFFIHRGECLGLVGESGCGKTTTSKMVMRAMRPDTGQITFNDRGQMRDVLALNEQELFDYRRKVQFIFQDPYSSLNPRMTVFDILSEPLIIHKLGDAEERFERVKELMQLVGLDVRFLRRYPHSFSGGQRQRIGIARALALQPELLICDEPVSALDVSIQAQVLNLLKDLKAELGLTYLFISHNLAVVDYIADRIAVMCAGRLVEMAPREALFSNPTHPYTKALLSAVPHPDPDSKLDLGALMEGRASDPRAWPMPFTINGSTRPALVDLGGGHFVRADPDGMHAVGRAA
ncbi:ABC transporter ATP-binding protein [Desertibaculum subflavum]|uniref:ABC transporter ATP-binding protein n=1 Tax=Desertibaculum subflavum TaxID=2268458 RepID=UPI000E66E3EE